MLVLLLQRCSLPVVGCSNGSSASRVEEKVWHFWTGGESLTASKHKDLSVFLEWLFCPRHKVRMWLGFG